MILLNLTTHPTKTCSQSSSQTRGEVLWGREESRIWSGARKGSFKLCAIVCGVAGKTNVIERRQTQIEREYIQLMLIRQSS